MLKLVLSVALLAVLGDAANIRTWSSRIVGGVDSASGDWPWQVSLRIENFFGVLSDHICGGSLINESHVLTAAHCVDGNTIFNDYVVIMGIHRRNDPGIFRYVSKVTIHAGYDGNAQGFPNDIAILELLDPVDFTDLVQPVNLPKASDEFMERECYITGWGVTTEGGGSLSDNLQKAQMEVISNDSCKKTWGTSILDSHICIDGADKSACNGDSGGPLVCNISGRWVLAGITSWGRSGCIANDFPSVYTRVTSYLTWI